MDKDEDLGKEFHECIDGLKKALQDLVDILEEKEGEERNEKINNNRN